ncbi:MAG: YceI family protein [Bacteroidota bacterium]|nr:YceI family protein [Bacteroidota bacterium]
MNVKISKKIFWLIAGCLIATAGVIRAQSPKIVSHSSSVTIYGTSNLHKWEMKVAQFGGDISSSATKQITSLVVKIPVQSIKSESSIMDGKAYDALKSKQNPNIIFQLSEAAPIHFANKDVEVTLSGNLTVAGVTKKITFKSTGKMIAEKSCQLTGSVPLKMTQFGMKPPTAMLGALKTGDDITVKFVVTLDNITTD